MTMTPLDAMQEAVRAADRQRRADRVDGCRIGLPAGKELKP